MSTDWFVVAIVWAYPVVYGMRALIRMWQTKRQRAGIIEELPMPDGPFIPVKAWRDLEPDPSGVPDWSFPEPTAIPPHESVIGQMMARLLDENPRITVRQSLAVAWRVFQEYQRKRA